MTEQNVNPVNPGIQQPVPNATAVLVLGILSLVFCCGIGWILAIIALVLTGGPRRMYEENPGNYSEASYKNLNAGRTCAIIGLILSVLVTAFYIIYYVVILGVALGSMPFAY